MDLVEDEGVDFSVDDPEKWSALSPLKGHVIEVYLSMSNYAAPADTWAAFLVTKVANRIDGSLVLDARCLGCEDPETFVILDRDFNQNKSCIHLCLTDPCIPPAEGSDTYLHTTRVRLWSLETFKTVQTFVEDAQMKKIPGWLGQRAPRSAPKATSKAGAAPRRRGHAAPPKEPGVRRRNPPDQTGRDTSRDKPVPKAGDAEPGDTKERKMLREKLKAARSRLQGDEPSKNPSGKKPEEEELVESSHGSGSESIDHWAENFKSTIEDGKLNSGAMIPAVEPRTLKEKGSTPKVGRDRSNRLLASLEDLPKHGEKGLSGQLVKRALHRI